MTGKRRPSRDVSRWPPLEELDELERRLEHIFRWPFLFALRYFPVVEKHWTPTIDLFEKGDRFVVKAELPGMKEEGIDVSVMGDILTVKGERERESDVKEEDYHRSEFTYGRFFRAIGLPTDVDADKMEASYEDGVLEVILPKATKIKLRKVAISSKKKEAGN